MPKKLLKNGEYFAVDYNLLDNKSFAEKMLIPFNDWQALSIEAQEIGVLIPADVDLELLKSIKEGYQWLAVEFSAFTDGRGFSIGRIIRDSIGYTGDLRAVGNIIPDQIASLTRSGFTSFELESDVNEKHIADILSPFTENYQASQNQPLPLFRRVDRG